MEVNVVRVGVVVVERRQGVAIRRERHRGSRRFDRVGKIPRQGEVLVETEVQVRLGRALDHQRYRAVGDALCLRLVEGSFHTQAERHRYVDRISRRPRPPEGYVSPCDGAKTLPNTVYLYREALLHPVGYP